MAWLVDHLFKLPECIMFVNSYVSRPFVEADKMHNVYNTDELRVICAAFHILGLLRSTTADALLAGTDYIQPLEIDLFYTIVG